MKIQSLIPSAALTLSIFATFNVAKEAVAQTSFTYNSAGGANWTNTAVWTPSTAYPGQNSALDTVTSSGGTNGNLNISANITIASLTATEAWSLIATTTTREFEVGSISKSGAGALSFANGSGTVALTTGLITVQGGAAQSDIFLGAGTASASTPITSLSANGVTLNNTGASSNATRLLLNVTSASYSLGLVTFEGTGTAAGAQRQIYLGIGNVARSSAVEVTGIQGGNIAQSRIFGGANAAHTPTLTINSSGNYSTNASLEDGFNSSTLAVVKSGLGSQTLTGNNTYTGSTTISAGTLVVSGTGSINNTSGITLNGSNAAFRYSSSTNSTAALTWTQGRLEGTNWNGSLAGLTIGANQTISPGNSPGTAFTTSQTWASGGSYLWEINNATGTAGSDPGWDLLSGTGTLNITASSGNEFTIYVTSLNLGNTAGDAVNFNNTINQSWLIADFANAISGFSADAFVIDTTNFTNPTLGGSFFSVVLGDTISGGDNTQLYLTYTIPEPSTWALLLAGAGLLAWRRRMV